MTAAIPQTIHNQHCFRVLLRALAKPGEVVPLDPTTTMAAQRAVLMVADALLDHEVSFAVAGDALDAAESQRFTREVELRTGAQPAPLEEAAFVFAFGTLGDGLAQLCAGDPLFPDRAATIVWAVTGFANGTTVELSGPGVAAVRRLTLAGVGSEDLARLAEINRGYPLGLDTFFVARDGAIVGLPRSTRIDLAGAEPGRS